MASLNTVISIDGTMAGMVQHLYYSAIMISGVDDVCEGAGTNSVFAMGVFAAMTV